MYIGNKAKNFLTHFENGADGGGVSISHLLQCMMELHSSKQEALLTPQSGADLLTHRSQLTAFGPDRILGIVGIFYEPVAFPCQ